MDEARKSVLEKASELLTSFWCDAKNPVQIAREIIPLNLEEDYFVQDRMHQLLDANISGWKVSATSPKMREIDGHEDIIPGCIFRSRTYIGTYQSMDINQFPNARVEAEFGFRLLEKPEVQRQPWTATEISSIMVLHHAVEIIGNRFRTEGLSKQETSLLTVADNGGGTSFVFGDPIENWCDINFKFHKISLTVNDRAAADNLLGDMRCFQVPAAADLINDLNERGISLSEGNFISTGAATMPQSSTLVMLLRQILGSLVISNWIFKMFVVRWNFFEGTLSIMNFYKKFDPPSLVALNLILFVNVAAENTYDLKNYLINSFGQHSATVYKPVSKYQQTNWMYRLVDLNHFERSAAALWLAIQISPILIISLKYSAPEYFKAFKHLMRNNLEG